MLIVSRSVGLLGLVLLVGSLVFPWFVIDSPVYRDRFTLYDVKVVHDALYGSCIYVGGSDCRLDTGLSGLLPLIIFVMFIVSWLASLVPELNLVSGLLGLMWSGFIYDDPGRLIVGSYSWVFSKYIMLDIGFYIYVFASIFFIVSGVVGFIERFRRRDRWY